MKFRITMKDPDGPYESLRMEAEDSLAQIEGLTDEEREALIDGRMGSMRVFASRWMRYGEYITIEFDTEANTAKVLEQS